MAGLTKRQENFCLAYMETGNATEAYRRSYSSKRMKSTTINRNAKTLMDNSNISARIEELTAPIRDAAGITLKNHLDKLEELRDLAQQSEQYNAAISAEEKRGKASGLYIEKIRQEGSITYEVVTNVPRSPDDPA